MYHGGEIISIPCDYQIMVLKSGVRPVKEIIGHHAHDDQATKHRIIDISVQVNLPVMKLNIRLLKFSVYGQHAQQWSL